MGRWRWVDEDEDGDGSMKIRDGLAEDEDKGWVGGAMCRGVVLGITVEDGFEQGRRSDWRGCAWVLQVECA